jgi:hypothetical protein
LNLKIAPISCYVFHITLRPITIKDLGTIQKDGQIQKTLINIGGSVI